MKDPNSILFESIEPLVRWYKKAQIDYVERYIRMYIAYNTWYREVVGSISDRRAIQLIKKREIIWRDYINGNTLSNLRPYMERLVDLTSHQPMASSNYWNGSIASVEDWQGLIEFWYQVRCVLVHGGTVEPKFVWLAYETLDTFLSEIISRMHRALEEYLANAERSLSEVSDIRSVTRERLRQKMQARYFANTKVWHVDMKRAP